MARSQTKKTSNKPNLAKPSFVKPGLARLMPSLGPYEIVPSKDFITHLLSGDHIRIALLDDAHGDEREVAANKVLLYASWELWRIVTEFITDVNAVRAHAPGFLCDEWPDLNDTYNSAMVLINKMEVLAQRIQEKCSGG